MSREDRLAAMQPSLIRLLHDEAQAMRQRGHFAASERSYIPLHFGEPDLGTPTFIVEAGCDALRGGAVFYENNSGRPDLKAALATFYQKQYGAKVTPEHFVVTCGGTQAIALTMLALVAPGDDVFNVTPNWPNFAGSAKLAGGVVHDVALRFDPDRGVFELDFEVLAATIDAADRPRMVIVDSPSNPTGWVITGEQRHELVELCRRRGLILMSDEIYDRLLFTGRPFPSAVNDLNGFDDIVVINGFSKTYCMTGWRVGYLVTHPERAAKMARMQEFVTSCAPSMAQVAAITALRDGEPFIAESLTRYQSLREIVTSRVSNIPEAKVANPQGGFYLFFSLKQSADSMGFCRRLLEETGVVLAPGIAFGESGEGWLRLCFANKPGALHEALTRVERFVAG